MALSTNNPYMHDIFTVKLCGKQTKITYLRCFRESGWEDERKTSRKGTINEEKLSNNLSRTKSRIKELALCNEWDYWCTLTFSPEKFDRFNRDECMGKFAKALNNYNRNKNEKVKYLLVPEKHRNGAWHLHGFLFGIPQEDLFQNQYGYLSWKFYNDKFGFISIDKIKDINKASNYILKYITKDVDNSVGELNKHSFYASHGLKKGVEVYRGSAEFKGEWDWEHPEGFCKIKTIDQEHENLSDYIEVNIENDNEESI